MKVNCNLMYAQYIYIIYIYATYMYYIQVPAF